MTKNTLATLKKAMENGNYKELEPDYNPDTLRHICSCDLEPFSAQIHILHATELSCMAGTLHMNNNNTAIIFNTVTFKESLSYIAGVIAHEAWHAIHHQLSVNYNIKPDKNCDELYAYTLEKLVRDIYEKLQPYLKKGKKK